MSDSGDYMYDEEEAEPSDYFGEEEDVLSPPPRLTRTVSNVRYAGGEPWQDTELDDQPDIKDTSGGRCSPMEGTTAPFPTASPLFSRATVGQTCLIRPVNAATPSPTRTGNTAYSNTASPMDTDGPSPSSTGSNSSREERPYIGWDMLEKLQELTEKQSHRWQPLWLPNDELFVAMDRALEITKERLDVNNKFASDQIHHLLEKVILPCFHKFICDENCTPNGEQIRGIMNLSCRFLSLYIWKLKQRPRKEEVCNPYWHVLRFILDARMRFYTKCRTMSINNVTHVVPGDIQHSLFSTLFKSSGGESTFWYHTLVLWFAQNKGFEAYRQFLKDNDIANAHLEEVFHYIDPYFVVVQYLKPDVIYNYFGEHMHVIIHRLINLTDKEMACDKLKGEVKDSYHLHLYRICRQMIAVCPRLGEEEDVLVKLDFFKLKFLKHVLCESVFNTRMSALDELNLTLRRKEQNGQELTITNEQLEQWIEEEGLVEALYKDNLHHVAYIDRLERVMSEMFEKDLLSESVLNIIWNAQKGKHDAILRNIHQLTARLVSKFSDGVMNGLFTYLEVSWIDGCTKERIVIIDLLKKVGLDFANRLTDERKVLSRVLEFLWRHARSNAEDVSDDLLSRLLDAHFDILEEVFDHSEVPGSVGADLMSRYIKKCVEDIICGNEDYVISALIHLKKMITLYPSESEKKRGVVIVRSDVISSIEKWTQNKGFCSIMVEIIRASTDTIDCDESPSRSDSSPDTSGRCSSLAAYHSVDLTRRLDFLQFYLESSLRGPADSNWAYALWASVIGNRHSTIRDLGYLFFHNIMSSKVSRIFNDTEAELSFFKDKVMSTPPREMTRLGLQCFDAFLKHVNHQLRYMDVLLMDHGGCAYQLKTTEFEGEEYLWQLVMDGNEDVQEAATLLVVGLFTNICSTSEPPEITSGKIMAKCMHILEKEFRSQPTNELGKQRRDMRLRNIIQAMIDLISTDEKEHLLCLRTRQPLIKSAMGKGCVVRVILKVEEFPSLYHIHINKMPKDDMHFEYLVNDNILFYDLILKIAKSLNNINAQAYPYGMYLTRKLITGGTQKIKPEDWGVTLRELSFDTQATFNIKMDRTRSGRNGQEDAEYTTAIDAAECLEREHSLFGVILSSNEEWIEKLVIMASEPELSIHCMRLLSIIPSCPRKVIDIRNSMVMSGLNPGEGLLNRIRSHDSEARQVYWLLLLHEMIMPAKADPTYRMASKNQLTFFHHQGLSACISLLTDESFICRSQYLRIMAYAVLTRIIRFGLHVVAPFMLKEGTESNAAKLLKFALERIPNTINGGERYMKKKASQLGESICEHAKDQREAMQKKLVNQIIVGSDVLMRTIKVVLSTVFFASRRHGIVFNQDSYFTEIDVNQLELDSTGEQLSMIAQHVLALLACINHGPAMEMLETDEFFNFLIVTVFDERKLVRDVCVDVFSCLIMVFNKFYPQNWPNINLVDRLFQFSCNEFANGPESEQFFELLEKCISLRNDDTSNSIEKIIERLDKYVEWLMAAKTYTQERQCHFDDDTALIGRLRLCWVLLFNLDPVYKLKYVLKEDGSEGLVEQLLNYFLLPSSRAFVQMQQQSAVPVELPRSQTAGEIHSASSSSMFDLHTVPNLPRSASAYPLPSRAVAVCGTQASQHAAFRLVGVLCIKCEPAMRIASDIIIGMFYKDRPFDKMTLDHNPDQSLRDHGNYVGLKNGGATCYMNSILQQMYMIPELRSAVICADTTNTRGSPDETPPAALEYPVRVLNAVQTVFAHLIGYELEAYTPREFWDTFRMNGDSMNVHEQQDALEFYNSVVDLLDEAMKKIGSEKMCEKTFGGLFADEKICKDCPHKYTREEPFTSISIDVRSHDNLPASLREYVKGDILENDNAYHCEECDRKVTAIKRLSLHRLPPHLVVQLKRFEFDWEKEQPVKYNDYFEFPMQLDMYPYTAEALAKKDEADRATADGNIPMDEERIVDPAYLYNLRGVVVHSGQATGGHYYSYIKSSDDNRWYKFDDTEVSFYEATAEDIRFKWFGADSNSNVMDDPFGGGRRRRQKNWWNAYILFYEKVQSSTDQPSPGLCSSLNQSNSSSNPIADGMMSSRRSSTASPVSRLHKHFSTMSLSSRMRQMPPHLESMVRRENTKIMHERNQYNIQYFEFIRSLSASALFFSESMPPTPEKNIEMLMLGTRLISYFFVYTYLNTNQDMRDSSDVSYLHHMVNMCRGTPGAASLMQLFDYVLQQKISRLWYINNILLNQQFCTLYLFTSNSQEVRALYTQMIIRTIEFCYLQRDTIEELKAPQLRTANLDILLNTLSRGNTVVGMLFESMSLLVRPHKHERDKLFEFCSAFLKFLHLQTEPQFNELFRLMARHGLANMLLVLMSSAYNMMANVYLAENLGFQRLFLVLMRCIDVTHALPAPRDNELVSRLSNKLPPNPYYHVENPIELTKIQDHTYLLEFVRCTGHKILSRLIQTMMDNTFFRIQNCIVTLPIAELEAHNGLDFLPWMQDSIKFLCWNNPSATQYTYDKIIAMCISQQQHEDKYFEYIVRVFLRLFRDVLSAKDAYHHKDGWLRGLLYRIDWGLHMHYNGLKNLLEVKSMKKQLTILKIIVIILEEYKEVAAELLRGEMADWATEAYAVFSSRFTDDPPTTLTSISSDDVPNRHDVIPRFLRFVNKALRSPDITDREGTSQDAEMAEPLDLSVSGSRSSTTTPQSGDKRPFPDDGHLTERRESKKFNDGSEGPRGALEEPEMTELLTSSTSVQEHQNLNPSAPPPAYDGPPTLPPPPLPSTKPPPTFNNFK